MGENEERARNNRVQIGGTEIKEKKRRPKRVPKDGIVTKDRQEDDTNQTKIKSKIKRKELTKGRKKLVQTRQQSLNMTQHSRFEFQTVTRENEGAVSSASFYGGMSRTSW